MFALVSPEMCNTLSLTTILELVYVQCNMCQLLLNMLLVFRAEHEFPQRNY